MEEKRVHLEVKGKVQGVFFRASTLNKARMLGVKGWIRNLNNGNVEIIAEGAEQSLIQLYNWCRIGPENAKVDSIDIKWESPENKFSDFDIIK